MPTKDWLRKNLPPATYRRLARTEKFVRAWWHRNDLNQLALIFGTDKWGEHWYTQHYQRCFAPLKDKHLNILEIGVGGYEDPLEGASSLRMWKAYFRRSRIAAIDLHDKSALSESRIDIRQCDQTDSERLRRLSGEYGGFDIIIDDGSHLNEHVIKTFHILFPLLRPEGIYAVEDTQTAYWPGWGGGIGKVESSMGFLKGLVDGLNHAEFPIPNYDSNYFEKNIVEIDFFHNLVIIHKGVNDEKATFPGLIKREIEKTTTLQNVTG